MASKSANRRSTRGEYIETETGNKISRRARIEGTPNIILGGRVVVQADACLRGDLCRQPTSTRDSSEPKDRNTRTSIAVGRYTLISTGATLHPPHRFVRNPDTGVVEPTYYPQKIGENVLIGRDAFVGAASIGNNVVIGEGAILENGVIVRDCIKILEGSVLPSGMVCPVGSVIGGKPAQIIGEVPDGWGVGAGGAGVGGDGAELYVEGGELRELIRSIKG